MFYLEASAADDAPALPVDEGGEPDGLLARAVGRPDDGLDDVLEGVHLVVVEHRCVQVFDLHWEGFKNLKSKKWT